MLFPNLIPKKLMKRFGLKISFGVLNIYYVFSINENLFTHSSLNIMLVKHGYGFMRPNHLKNHRLKHTGLDGTVRIRILLILWRHNNFIILYLRKKK